MRLERICQISFIDQEYPSLSVTRRNWPSGQQYYEPELAPLQVTGVQGH